MCQYYRKETQQWLFVLFDKTLREEGLFHGLGLYFRQWESKKNNKQ